LQKPILLVVQAAKRCVRSIFNQNIFVVATFYLVATTEYF